MHPFSKFSRAFPDGAGYCPQCGMLCRVDPDNPRVNHTAESRFSARCHGCEYANAVYASTQTWYGHPWRNNPDLLPSVKRAERVYAYYGPVLPFAVWIDTRENSAVAR